MAKFLKFIGNTKIIAPSELPKIGDKGDIGHTNEICVSVELTDSPVELKGYVCYNVYYANLGEYFDKDVNICRFSMAIKLDEFVKYYTEVKQHEKTKELQELCTRWQRSSRPLPCFCKRV